MLHTPPKPNNTELIKKTKKHNPLGNLSTGYENNIEIDLLKSKLDRFAENVSAKLDDLAFEINHIKENKPYSIVILEDVINDLKKEKLELRKINDDHQERIIDMSRTISDLKLINKNLEEEKSSLLTTIRLIQIVNRVLSWEKEKLRKKNQLHGKFQTEHPKQSFIFPSRWKHPETSNQYAILSGSDTNAQQLQVPLKLHGSDQNQRTRQQHTVMDTSPQNTTAYTENHEMQKMHSHKCKTTVRNYRRQCNHTVLNNDKKTQFQHVMALSKQEWRKRVLEWLFWETRWLSISILDSYRMVWNQRSQ